LLQEEREELETNFGQQSGESFKARVEVRRLLKFEKFLVELGQAIATLKHFVLEGEETSNLEGLLSRCLHVAQNLLDLLLSLQRLLFELMKFVLYHLSFFKGKVEKPGTCRQVDHIR